MRTQATILLISLLTFTLGSVSADWNGQKFEAAIRRLQQQEEIRITSGKKKCIIDGDRSCTSTYYVYKEFENGVTFAQAHAATGYDPELDRCVLAPIYSYEDLLQISDAIPQCKAAYTAASKDALTTYRQSESCLNQGQIPYNCDYATLGETLDDLWGDNDTRNNNIGTFGACSLDEWFQDTHFLAGAPLWCPSLRENWVNFGSSEAIPPEVWKAGDSSYCGDGPIHNAGAAFATDYSNHEPTAILKAVNSGEYLDGAVYQCCQSLVAC